MKKMIYIMVLCIQVFVLLFSIDLSANQDNSISKKYFQVIAETGAGHLVYAGAGYDLARRFSLFKDHQYLKSAGFLFGFSYFNEDSVYLYEPSLFLSGEIINNKIKIYSGYSLDIDWRFKLGKTFVHSTEYNVSGSALAYGLDFLFYSFKYFYFDISFPFVSGSEGTEIAPCLGAGFYYHIF